MLEMKNKKRIEENKRLDKIKINSHGTKQERNIANIHHLTRIITFLSEVDYSYKTEIKNELGMDTKRINSALAFLLNYKIVFIHRKENNEINYYKLNPFFKR